MLCASLPGCGLYERTACSDYAHMTTHILVRHSSTISHTKLSPAAASVDYDLSHPMFEGDTTYSQSEVREARVRAVRDRWVVTRRWRWVLRSSWAQGALELPSSTGRHRPPRPR